ncbi:MAG: hypothetical protein RIS70_1371 [Planctomycetota bacterium]|jgi:hypothetical protein
MMAQAQTGRVKKAADSAEALRMRLFPNPGTLYSLAAAYAVCHSASKQLPPETRPTPEERATRFAAPAIELLNEAVTRGFADPVMLSTDPDFRSLRTLPEFEAILKRPSAG